MKENTKKNNIFFVIIFFIIVFFILAFLYSRNLATKGLIIKEYKIESDVLPSYFSGLKIIHFSDIYYDNTTTAKDLENLVEKINTLKPDLVFFTGDLFKRNKKISEETENEIINILEKLSASLGKYAVKGDLDYKLSSYDIIMKEANFILMENSYELVYKEGLEPIFLCGLGSKLENNQNSTKCFEYYELNKDNDNVAKYKIFLVHEGDSAVDILNLDDGVNLILGGHSLGGLLDIPYYGPVLIPKGSRKYFASFYKEGNSNIYISSGIGTDEKRIRLFNKPSFNFYRLKSLQ